MDANKKQFYLDNSFVVISGDKTKFRHVTEYRTGRVILVEVAEPNYFNLISSSLLMFKTFEQFAINLATVQSHFDRVGVKDDDLVYRMIEAMIADIITVQDVAINGIDIVARRPKQGDNK